MRYLSSYSLIKESVVEAKNYWKNLYASTSSSLEYTDNPYLEHFKTYFRKTPGYIGGFMKLFINECIDMFISDNGYSKTTGLISYLKFMKNYKFNLTDLDNSEVFGKIKIIYEKILKYKQLFTDLDLNKYKRLEELSDYVENTIIDSQRLQFVKKFISSKYIDLVNDDTIRLFDNLRKVIGDDHSTFNKIILSKIASFKTTEEFNKFLNNYLRQFGDWNVDKLETKSIDAGANIIFKDSDVLIVETPTHHCLRKLGSQNWCIVRDFSYWNDYLKNDREKVNLQYIIFNTGLDQSNVSSMIGVTVVPSGKIKAAHRLDDSGAKPEDYSVWKEYLKPISREDLRKTVESTFSFNWIFEYGFIEDAKVLKDKGYDFSKNNNAALSTAINYGYFDIIKLILTDPRVDPSFDDNRSICYAAANGYIYIINLLLTDSRVDPSAMNNVPIKYAATNKHFDVVRLLAKDTRVQKQSGKNEEELLDQYL